MKNKTIVVVDTSAFMSGLSFLENNLETYTFVTTTIVEEELDNLSKSDNKEKAFKAREALRFIEKNENLLRYELNERTDEEFFRAVGLDERKNDNLILLTALKLGAKIFTFDRAMKSKAKLLKLERLDVNKDGEESFYKGYKEITGTSQEIEEFYEKIYNGEIQFLENEYLLVCNTDTGKETEQKWVNGQLKDLNLPNAKDIKGMNNKQRCALDLLNNTNVPIKVIMGTWGSGKTYLATQMGLLKIKKQGGQSKILVVREPIGEGKEVGFLKGDFDDKTKDFYKPIEHSLEGKEFELESLIQRGMLEKAIPYYLKGTTYNKTFILCDEASDLSLKQIKMIGTRLGEGSEIVFVGDYKQSVFDSTLNNGLIRLVESLKGNSMFGVITLDVDVRSEASRVFAEME